MNGTSTQVILVLLAKAIRYTATSDAENTPGRLFQVAHGLTKGCILCGPFRIFSIENLLPYSDKM